MVKAMMNVNDNDQNGIHNRIHDSNSLSLLTCYQFVINFLHIVEYHEYDHESEDSFILRVCEGYGIGMLVS